MALVPIIAGVAPPLSLATLARAASCGCRDSIARDAVKYVHALAAIRSFGLDPPTAVSALHWKNAIHCNCNRLPDPLNFEVSLNHKSFSSFAVQLSQNPSVAKESLEGLPSHVSENKTGKVF